jgi:hypothetical protein
MKLFFCLLMTVTMQAESICGKTLQFERASVQVLCVNFDALRQFMPIPPDAPPKQMQLYVTPINQDAYAVEVVTNYSSFGRVKQYNPVAKQAIVILNGWDHEIKEINLLVMEPIAGLNIRELRPFDYQPL